VINPDNVLSAEETALVSKAEHEMRLGKYVTLDQLQHDLDRPPHEDAAKPLKAFRPTVAKEFSTVSLLSKRSRSAAF
jgi:hypothetical protein